MAWLDDWANRLELTIDGDRVGGDLENFPVLITLTSGSGRNNYNTALVFDELAPLTGNGIVYQDDFSTNDGYGWIPSNSGTLSFTNDQVENIGSVVAATITTSGTLSALDWEIRCQFSCPSANPGYSWTTCYWHYVDDDNYFLASINRRNTNNRLYFYARRDGVDYITEALAKYDYNAGGNILYSIVVRKQGNAFYIKHWRTASDSEPLYWDRIIENSEEHPTSGNIRVLFSNNVSTAYFDELTFNDISVTPNYPYKIAVTDYTGINKLYTEIEYWNPWSQTAYLWTKVPTLTSGTDATLYLYYDSNQLDNDVWVNDTGSAASINVWSNGYAAVYHMSQSPVGSNSIKDSKGFNDGTPAGSLDLTDLVEATPGKGINFDGSSDTIDVGTHSSLNVTNLSVEAMINPSSVTGSHAIFHKGNTAVAGHRGWWVNLEADEVYAQTWDGAWRVYESNNANLSTSTDYFIGVTLTTGASPCRMFKNDIELTGPAATSLGYIDTSDYAAYIGNLYQGTPSTWFDGTISELRISDTIRSAAWLKATYYSNFDNFMTFAAGGTPPPPGPPEPDWWDSWANRLEITATSDWVDEDLAYFPVLITLSSGTGRNNFDNTYIFDHLTTGSGIDSYTSFMLPTDGDRSSSQHDAIAFAYEPTITTVGGKSCVSLNGSNQCVIGWEDHNDWHLGLDDFTLEAYINADNFSAAYRVLAHGNLAIAGEWCFGIGYNASWGAGTRMNFAYNAGSVQDRNSRAITGEASTGTWYHVAMVRISGVLYFFFDGLHVGTANANYDLDPIGGTGENTYLFIGARRSGGGRAEHFPGYQTRWAIHKGIARYDSVMTANNESTYTQYGAFQLIDSSLTGVSFWEDSTTGGYPVWCKYDLGTGNADAVAEYDISSGADFTGRMPKDWQLQGSNNDSDWDTLSTISGATSWGTGETRTYPFSNTTDYRYYRLYITDGNHATLLRMYGWKLRDSVSGTVGSYQGDVIPPPEFPTNDQYTKFLYNCEGDGSQYNHNLNMISDPEVHMSNPATNGKGYWYFDGVGSPDDAIEVYDHSSLDFGSGDFTIEFWFYTINYSSIRGLFARRRNGDGRWVAVQHRTDGVIKTLISNSSGSWAFNQDIASVPAGEWIYYAVTRENDTIRVYLNGILHLSDGFTGSVSEDGAPLTIGSARYLAAGYEGHYGYIQGFKVSKGIARYTGNRFSPPDLPGGDSWINRKKIQLADAEHNRLYTEIEQWDHANGVAKLWTKAPVLTSDTDTTLYLYYDNTQIDNTVYVGDVGEPAAENVWTGNNFTAVYHMSILNELTTTNFLDSTPNNNVGYFNNMDVFDFTEGQASRALDFTRAGSEYIGFDTESAHDLTSDYTVEAVFRPIAGDVVNQIINKTPSDVGGFQLRGDSGDGPNFYTGTGTVAGRAGWTAYGWQYAACVLSGTTLPILYMDGYFYDSSSSTGTPSNANALFIGRRWDAHYFDGDIDEVRISDVPRSSAWVKANYYNMWHDLLSYAEDSRPFATCSGITYVNDVPWSGLPVRLYRRSTGELIGTTTTISGGHFEIPTQYDEDHYIISMYVTDSTNALIFDWINPHE